MTSHTLFFDLFNTLVSVGGVPDHVGRFTADILGIDREVWNEACFGPEHEICQPTRHVDVIGSIARAIDPSITRDLIEQASIERQRRFDHALLNIQQDILAALQTLRQAGYRLGLISNASTAEVAAWQESPLAALFDLSVFSCDCGLQKPDVAVYEYAAGRLGVQTADCLYVGDGGSHEFIGANHAGMHTVLTRHFLNASRYKKVIQQQGRQIRSEIDHIRQLSCLLYEKADWGA